MSDQYPQNAYGKYLKAHDESMQKLIGLFSGQNLPKDRKGEARKIFNRMKEYPELNHAAGIDSVRNVLSDPKRLLDAVAKLESGGQAMTIDEAQEFFGEVSMRRNFWDDDFEAVIAKVSTHLASRPA